jgi:hypothetical protein
MGPVVKIETRYDGGEGHMVLCWQGSAEVGMGPVGAEMKFP